MSGTTSIDTEALVKQWAAGWSSKDPQPWLSMYSSRCKYIDHAFQIVRIGSKETLPSHFDIWRTAHPDFKMTATTIYPPVKEAEGKVKVIFRTDNEGTFENDLPRGRKATGKPFLFKGVVELVIDEKSGLIEVVDEWYSTNFERFTSVEKEYNSKEDPQ